MSDNMKNKLQIYCQQNKLSLPEYSNSMSVEGKWISTVTFKYGEFQSDPCDKKTTADISAATKAIQMLNAGMDTDTEDHSSLLIKQRRIKTIDDMIKSAVLKDTSPFYVLVDYENINKLSDLNYVFKNSKDQEVTTYRFLAYNHHNTTSDHCSHIVNSGGSDAVDMAIAMFVGMLLANCRAQRQPLTIIILTGDSFAECVQNFTRSVECPSVFHIPTEQDCVSILNERGFERTDNVIKWY